MELQSLWGVAKSRIYDYSGRAGFVMGMFVVHITMRIAFQRGAVEQGYDAKLD